MKYDWTSSSSDTTTSGHEPSAAPGKQTLTERLVQRKQRSVPPMVGTDATPMAASEPTEDPFALHLAGTVQRSGDGAGDPRAIRAAAAVGVAGGGGAMPFADTIQASFGSAADVSQIRAHVGGPAADACDAMGASAYATGANVAFASTPDLHTAAHEAAHVVQQAQGVNLYGGVGAAGDAYEAHADQVADRVVAGQSAEALLHGGPRGGAAPAAANADEADEDAELESELEAAGPVQMRARRSGGGLAGKANMLLQWRNEMVEVARMLAGQFTPLGLHFRPQILLATAMQESAASDPLNARSFDNGLGMMQITPYRGRLDPQVARAIGWDNSRGLAANMRSANWRSARANLLAGAYTMLAKAKAIKRGVARIWEQMDEPHRWRAVLFAYNAGEGSAINALRRGGANAAMISSFTNARGQRVSHDYTQEINAKMDYVDSHDPFGGGGGGGGAALQAPVETEDDDAEPSQTSGGHSGGGHTGSGHSGGGHGHGHGGHDGGTHGQIGHSVGRHGRNRRRDVRRVQEHLRRHGYTSVGRVDGLFGPKTRHAIEQFQRSVVGVIDGLIEPGRETFQRLFGHGAVPGPDAHGHGHGGHRGGGHGAHGGTHPAGGTGGEGSPRHAPTTEPHPEAQTDGGHHETPSWRQIAGANFAGQIPGSNLTWHQALWLPSFHRHVQPSDLTNISVDTLLANIERQAAALTAVSHAIGKSIVVHCWVRPPAYNRRIGGASNSAHLRGTATDFHCPGMTAEQVRQAVKSRHLYPGAGENNVSWVHLDLEHSRWFNP